MDFLKRNYEKVLLSVGLLALIGFLVGLKLVTPSPDEAGTRGRGPKPKPVMPLDLSGYSNAIQAVSQPAQWASAAVDLFNTTPPPSTGTTNIIVLPPVVGIFPVQLLRITRQPFKLLFVAYSGEGNNFQLNFQFRPRTFFVPEVGMEVGDRYESTGYKIVTFARKSTNVVTSVGPREIDISELTLQRAGEDAIVLVKEKEAVEREPVATYRCGAGEPREIRRGQRFDCAEHTYIVVDIGSKQMIIEDLQSKERRNVDLTGSSE